MQLGAMGEPPLGGRGCEDFMTILSRALGFPIISKGFVGVLHLELDFEGE